MKSYYALNKQLQLSESTPEKTNWIHLEKPTLEEIEELTSTYHLPLDYLTAVLDNQEISRQEHLNQKSFDHPVLLILQYPTAGTSPSGYKQFETLPFSIIFTQNIIVTSSNTSLSIQEMFASKLKLPQNIDLYEAVTLKLSWYFASLFNYYIRTISAETDLLEAELQNATENKQLYQLMDMQKSLIYFDAALEQNLAIYRLMSTSPILFHTKEEHALLFDIMIETKQAISSADIQAQVLNQLGNMFSAIISNNMNIVMKVLTVITIVLTIPTIIGGVYGMNVKLPFANEDNMFWWLTFATFALSILTIWWLRFHKFF
ncbi:magnesium transporter CorA family protein [Vagococcus humatus]|uniref:Magnesium transporter CorA n=1 Tax=Vagococcus humatus TaxID=1889241 RepID=A0A429Z6X5_9ENTE|nr:magnesium transporter CorA family protein [Vagococcus humatus]RST89457.1 magnesium transporter CorA [Vagococcus humatus]